MLTRQKSALNRLKLFPTVVTNLYYVEILSTGKYSACRFMLQGNDINSLFVGSSFSYCEIYDTITVNLNTSLQQYSCHKS